MIRAHLYLFNGDVILLPNISKESLRPLLNLALQHIVEDVRE